MRRARRSHLLSTFVRLRTAHTRARQQKQSTPNFVHNTSAHAGFCLRTYVDCLTVLYCHRFYCVNKHRPVVRHATAKGTAGIRSKNMIRIFGCGNIRLFLNKYFVPTAKQRRTVPKIVQIGSSVLKSNGSIYVTSPQVSLSDYSGY